MPDWCGLVSRSPTPRLDVRLHAGKDVLEVRTLQQGKEQKVGTALGEDLLDAYRQRGFLFPLPALSNWEVATLRAKLEELEAQHGGKLPPPINRKPHLLLMWLNELIRDPRILDPVAEILGPNILCWASGFFIKNPHDKARVSWHQDSTYWGLSSPDVVTAWVAFTPSCPANGCMRVVPGTHLLEQLPHEDTFAPDNLLSRGQEIAVEVDESSAVDIVLAPGQMSLHHVLLVHGSEPNQSDARRIGFAIRYLPTYIKQRSALADSATLVRGSDQYRHFLPEPVPQSDFHPDAVAFHAQMLATNDQILYGQLQPRKEDR
jgi:non-heme Fe2+,alpha-ketoglutarate-dependent halogenase